MSHEADIPPEVLAEMYPQWGHSRISHRDFQGVVVDMQVLSAELTKLVDTCLDIEKQSQVLLRSVQEQV